MLGDALTRPTGKEVPPVQVAPVADGSKPGVASGSFAGVASVAHGSNAGVAPVADGSNTVRAGEEGN